MCVVCKFCKKILILLKYFNYITRHFWVRTQKVISTYYLLSFVTITVTHTHTQHNTQVTIIFCCHTNSVETDCYIFAKLNISRKRYLIRGIGRKRSSKLPRQVKLRSLNKETENDTEKYNNIISL